MPNHRPDRKIPTVDLITHHNPSKPLMNKVLFYVCHGMPIGYICGTDNNQRVNKMNEQKTLKISESNLLHTEQILAERGFKKIDGGYADMMYFAIWSGTDWNDGKKIRVFFQQMKPSIGVYENWYVND